MTKFQSHARSDLDGIALFARTVCAGTVTSTVTNKSPVLLARCNPRPRTRNVWPALVPGGIFQSDGICPVTAPLRLAPSTAASGKVTGTLIGEIRYRVARRRHAATHGPLTYKSPYRSAVSPGLAAMRHSNALAVFYPRRHAHLHLTVLAQRARPETSGAGINDLGAATVAFRTRRSIKENNP